MTLSDLLAAGTEVVVGGESFTLRPPTLAEQGAFAAWLKDRAKREAATADPQTPEGERDRAARVVYRDIAEGYYEPDAPGFVAATQRPDGMARYLWTILRTDHPGVTEAGVRRAVEDGLAREWVRVMEMEADDPKTLAALVAALGFPASWLTSSGPSSSGSPTPPSTGAPGKSGG